MTREQKAVLVLTRAKSVLSAEIEAINELLTEFSDVEKPVRKRRVSMKDKIRADFEKSYASGKILARF